MACEATKSALDTLVGELADLIVDLQDALAETPPNMSSAHNILVSMATKKTAIDAAYQNHKDCLDGLIGGE